MTLTSLKILTASNLVGEHLPLLHIFYACVASVSHICADLITGKSLVCLSVCLSVCLYVCVDVTMVRVKSHPSRHWLAELRLKKRSKWWRVSSFHSTTRSSTTLLNRRPWVSNSKPTRPPSSSASTLHPPTSFHLFLTCSSCQFSAETVYLGQCLVIFVCHYLWGLHY